jgi:GntR family transcriptional regulator / MocR family aminotransferase
LLATIGFRKIFETSTEAPDYPMELAIALDHHSPYPLHLQLAEGLRRVILAGKLLPGQRLPSTRSLAQSLHLSRTTVTHSYDQLLSEGYLETRPGSGTFVCAQLPDNLLRTDPIESVALSPPPPIHVSRYGTHLAETAFALLPEPQTEISFRYGRPTFPHFPMAVWRKLLARHCRDDFTWLDYARDPQGYYPLRVAIAQYLARARAVTCQPEQIILTNGTQQALDLMLRIVLEPGETIALEDPGYLSARRIFLSHGAQLLPIPVDVAGLDVASLVAADPCPRLVYVTPSHQFPTGAVLSLPRRLELLKWAERVGALILEDDYDSEYRYGVRGASVHENRPIPALQGLDQSGVVVYMGTFSKVLFPSLRIGYLVLPPHWVSIVAYGKWLSDRQLPILEQRVLTDFLTEGHLESHIRKMRSHYDRRRQTLVQALEEQFGDRVIIFGEQAGIHVMVQFSVGLTGAEILKRAEAAGVGLMAALPHYLQGGKDTTFILGYGELEEGAIAVGMARLAKALR